MPYIISRASQSTEYTSWTKGRNGENKRLKSVLIKGGANVVDKKTLETPAGVITEVSAEDLKFFTRTFGVQTPCCRRLVEY